MQSKRILTVLCGIMLLISPVLARADAVGDLEAQLQSLLSALLVLQTNTASSTPGAIAPSSTPSTSCPNLPRTLSVGSQGSDVLELQQFLATQGFLTADSMTGYFGTLTEAAVKKWQVKVSIINSAADAQAGGFGVAGPLTRAAIANVCAQSASGIHTVTAVECPIYAQPACTAGTALVSLGIDGNGCSTGYQCVPAGSIATSTCPSVYVEPVCTGSEILTAPLTDQNGCAVAQQCVLPSSLPAIAASPAWGQAPLTVVFSNIPPDAASFAPGDGTLQIWQSHTPSQVTVKYQNPGVYTATAYDASNTIVGSASVSVSAQVQ